MGSNLKICLEARAEVTGSINIADYQYEGKKLGLFYVDNAENIAFDGRGVINGNGDSFMDMDLTKGRDFHDFHRHRVRQGSQYLCCPEDLVDGPVKAKERPAQMFIFSNCRKISMRDITI